MADTDTETLPNGTGALSEEDERMKQRPADIDADVREMERRKRVEALMSSKLFREELERVLDQQLHEGGDAPLLQRIREMVGGRLHTGSLRGPTCVLPINDIRGIEGVGYEKGEKILRCKLAAVYRLVDLFGWTQTNMSGQITARLNTAVEQVLTTPRGLLPHEVTASSLVKVDMQGNIVDQGTTNFPVNVEGFSVHGAVHAARPDLRCVLHVRSAGVLAVSCARRGLLPLCHEAALLGDVAYHTVPPGVLDNEEQEKLVRALGPHSKVLILSSSGALCCGATLEEAFYTARNLTAAADVQLRLQATPVDELYLLPEDTRKQIYEASRKAPSEQAKWRVGGEEFEALMRMLDNAGFRTGYIYRHPLIKNDVPKPKNDVEVPPAVSSLGYLLEEEELYRQGLWKRGLGGMSGGERTRWLNSPNVYQKVEVLETGTNDPRKITKWVDANTGEWVQDGSPGHSSTPVKIDTLQFVPKNTNPKEFKALQQQIKDNRRADKISAGPQSHILEGVTWDEAAKLAEDAQATHTGDHVVLMGAASKGIIQRGYQHNATVYAAPYARNPFDHVTDTEIDEYKRVVERKQKGQDYDTDLSESEPLSASAHLTSPDNNAREHDDERDGMGRVVRIETAQAPVRSQPEVVLSDDTTDFLHAEREHADRTKESNLPPDEEAFSSGVTSHATSSVTSPTQAQVVRAQQTVVRELDPNLLPDDEVFLDSAASPPTSSMTSPVTSPQPTPNQPIVVVRASVQIQNVEPTQRIGRGTLTDPALTEALAANKRSLHEYSRTANFTLTAQKFDTFERNANFKSKVQTFETVERDSDKLNTHNFENVEGNANFKVKVQNYDTFERHGNSKFTAQNFESVERTNFNITTHKNDNENNEQKHPKCKISLNTKLTDTKHFNENSKPNFDKNNPDLLSKVKSSAIDLYKAGRASSQSSLCSIPSIEWDGRCKSEYALRTRSLPRTRKSSSTSRLYRTQSHGGFVNFTKDPEPRHYHLPRCNSCGAPNTSYAWEVSKEFKKSYSLYESVGNLHQKCLEEIKDTPNVVKVTESFVPVFKVAKVQDSDSEFVESQEFTEDNYLGDIGNSFSSENKTIVEKLHETVQEVTLTELVDREDDKVENLATSEASDTSMVANCNTEGVAIADEAEDINNNTLESIEGEYHSFNEDMDFEEAVYESPVKDLVEKDIRDYSVPIDVYCKDYKQLSPEKSHQKRLESNKATLEPILEESKSSYDDSGNISNEKLERFEGQENLDISAESSKTCLMKEDSENAMSKIENYSNILETKCDDTTTIDDKQSASFMKINDIESKGAVIGGHDKTETPDKDNEIENEQSVQKTFVDELLCRVEGAIELKQELSNCSTKVTEFFDLENIHRRESYDVIADEDSEYTTNDIVTAGNTVQTAIDLYSNLDDDQDIESAIVDDVYKNVYEFLSFDAISTESKQKLSVEYSVTSSVELKSFDSTAEFEKYEVIADVIANILNVIDALDKNNDMFVNLPKEKTGSHFDIEKRDSDFYSEETCGTGVISIEKSLTCAFEEIRLDCNFKHKDGDIQNLIDTSTHIVEEITEDQISEDVAIETIDNMLQNEQILLLQNITESDQKRQTTEHTNYSHETNDTESREHIEDFSIVKMIQDMELTINLNETILTEASDSDLNHAHKVVEGVLYYLLNQAFFTLTDKAKANKERKLKKVVTVVDFEDILLTTTPMLLGEANELLHEYSASKPNAQEIKDKESTPTDMNSQELSGTRRIFETLSDELTSNMSEKIKENLDSEQCYDLHENIVDTYDITDKNTPENYKTDEIIECQPEMDDLNLKEIEQELSENKPAENSSVPIDTDKQTEEIEFTRVEEIEFCLHDALKQQLSLAQAFFNEEDTNGIEEHLDKRFTDTLYCKDNIPPDNTDFDSNEVSLNNMNKEIQNVDLNLKNLEEEEFFAEVTEKFDTNHDRDFEFSTQQTEELVGNAQEVKDLTILHHATYFDSSKLEENDDFNTATQSLQDSTIQDSTEIATEPINSILQQSLKDNDASSKDISNETYTLDVTEDFNKAFVEPNDYYSRSSSPNREASVFEVCTESPIRNPTNSFIGDDLSVLYEKNDTILGSPFVKQASVISMSQSANSGGIKYWLSFDDSLTEVKDKPAFKSVRKSKENSFPSFFTVDFKEEKRKQQFWNEYEKDTYKRSSVLNLNESQSDNLLREISQSEPCDLNLEGKRKRRSILLADIDQSSESNLKIEESFASCASTDYNTCESEQSSKFENIEPTKVLLYDSRFDLHTSSKRQYASWPPFEDTLFYRIISKFRMSESFDPKDFEDLKIDVSL